VDEAVSFDPSLLAAATTLDQYDGSEKGHGHGHSHEGSIASGPGYSGYNQEPVSGYGTYHSEPVQFYEQPYHSAYVPPMPEGRAEAQSSFIAGTASPPQNYLPPSEAAAKYNIPRVPVPAPALPETFGDDSVDHSRRQSVEEAAFWAKTLKVTNQ
jgi:hypothetical protein